MKANIIIFGKNSVLAQNYIKQEISERINFIFISRKSEDTNDIELNIGNYISVEEYKNAIIKIKNRLIHKKTICILFSWVGNLRKEDFENNFWEINLNIINNFQNICRELSPSRIIFLSSAGALYSQKFKSYKFKETDFLSPETTYGKLKLFSENSLLNYAKAYKFNITILRISAAYGYDKRFSDQGVINKWIHSALNDKPLELYNSKNSLINFISFDQISQALICSINNEINGVYNIGQIKSITLNDLIKRIKDITNKEIKVKSLGNSIRYFNIDCSKFYSKSDLNFNVTLNKDIRYIYDAIVLKLNKNK